MIRRTDHDRPRPQWRFLRDCTRLANEGCSNFFPNDSVSCISHHGGQKNSFGDVLETNLKLQSHGPGSKNIHMGMPQSFRVSNLHCQGCELATYRHMYPVEPKEPTQFGSVSGSGIQNLPFSHSGMVSLNRSDPKEPT